MRQRVRVMLLKPRNVVPMVATRVI